MRIALTKTNTGLIHIAGLDENGSPLMAVSIPLGKLKKMFPTVIISRVLDSEESRAILYPDWIDDGGDIIPDCGGADPDQTNESELD